MLYNHYVKIKGQSAPWTTQYWNKSLETSGGVEIGSGAYGSPYVSGYYDTLGWGTILYHLNDTDVIAARAAFSSSSSISTSSSSVPSSSSVLQSSSTPLPASQSSVSPSSISSSLADHATSNAPQACRNAALPTSSDAESSVAETIISEPRRDSPSHHLRGYGHAHGHKH